MTTAKAGLWLSAPRLIARKMFTLVGERNPLEIIAQTASTLGDIVR